MFRQLIPTSIPEPLVFFAVDLLGLIQHLGRFTGAGVSPDERARLKELEAKNAKLRMERDLLKRTVAFWVKEST